MAKSNTQWWVAAIAVLAIGAGQVPAARAQSSSDIEVQLQVKPQDPGGKNKDDAPMIEATVIGAPNLTPDKFILVDKSTKPLATEMKATSKRNFNQGTETLAVAIVMLGWEMWIGNSTYTPPEDVTYTKGVLIELQAALDKLNFKEAGPPGSTGMAIMYADTATIKVPMGPLANLSGSALGTQKDYAKTKGTELVKGVELALAELRKSTAARKVMIVVTDGNDTNNDAAKGQLTVLKKQAQTDRVQTFAIVFKAPDSGENNVIIQMIQQTSTVTTAENIATSIQSILARMADRQYLTFPGYAKDTKLGFKWDGKPHELTLKLDKEEAEPVQIVLSPIWSAEAPAGFPWLILILVLVLLLILIIVGVKVFSKKPEPIMAPVQMPMAAPVEAAPKPMGPAKTVMIGQGGEEGGFPVVGWLVPLNGPIAYQTMRLRGGGTKIGTAPPADIVINDGFMSTDHCHIHCSPTGFSLVDPGSTNGCYVNDKRVSKHELVDNDVITLGKTNLKFKSIV